uniref:Uncharacterized protein n=1 Tax=Oxyrrhis marina TaxID=2969 RepID=A0A7S3UJ67_OXYMA
MLPLLRSALRTRFAAAAQQQASRKSVIPIDWVWRYGPTWLVQDKVKWMYYYNIFVGGGTVLLVIYAHEPFGGADNNERYGSGPWAWHYHMVKNRLKNSGELEDNLRVKVTSFYPPEFMPNAAGGDEE